jgi:hypothetical protein
VRGKMFFFTKEAKILSFLYIECRSHTAGVPVWGPGADRSVSAHWSGKGANFFRVDGTMFFSTKEAKTLSFIYDALRFRKGPVPPCFHRLKGSTEGGARRAYQGQIDGAND